MKAKRINRGGRPRLAPVRAGQKTSLSVRISPVVRKEIEKASAKSGRSISQEAETRLERSFFEDVLHSESTTLFRLYQLQTFRAVRTVLLAEGGLTERHAAVEKLLAEMEEDFRDSRLQGIAELEDGKIESLKELGERLGEDDSADLKAGKEEDVP